MSRYGRVKLPLLAAGFCLASAVSAGAQTASLLSSPAPGKADAAPASDPSSYDPSKYDPSKYDPWAGTRPAEPTDDVAEAATTPVDAGHDDDMKNIDVDKLDWSQLGADAATLPTHKPGKTQSAAKAEQVGIWQGQFELPWEWRAAQSEQTDSSSIVSPTPSAVSPAAASKQSGACDIKGNISRTGERIYHMPGQKYYARTRVSTGKGERWFCSEYEARAAGWRRSQR